MKWLLLIMQYFPVVLQSVVAVEQTIGLQSGATKKQVVLDSITSAAKVVETVDDTHIKAISTLIDSVVSTLNASGVFKKSAPQA